MKRKIGRRTRPASGYRKILIENAKAFWLGSASNSIPWPRWGGWRKRTRLSFSRTSCVAAVE